MKFDKQRGEERKSLAVEAKLLCGDKEHRVMLRNASSLGVLAELDYPLRQGARVRLIAGSTVVDGRVRWMRMDSCGIVLQSPIDVDALAGSHDLSITELPDIAILDKLGSTIRRFFGPKSAETRF